MLDRTGFGFILSEHLFVFIYFTHHISLFQITHFSKKMIKVVTTHKWMDKLVTFCFTISPEQQNYEQETQFKVTSNQKKN